MSFNELIVNGGFETGTLEPWTALNTLITDQYSHSGLFAARLVGGASISYLFQFVPVNPGQRFEFRIYLAKIGIAPSPPVSISVGYYNEAKNFLGYGFVTSIQKNLLAGADENDWLEVNKAVDPAPAGSTQALVFVNKLPQSGSADIIVDDISLLETQDVTIGTITDYAYIYNKSDQVVHINEKVKFDSNGIIIGGIGHLAGDGDIILLKPGDYKISFSVAGADANQFGLFLNDTLVSGTIYGSGNTNQQNTGQAVISVNDPIPSVLNLRNHTSNTPVALQSVQGGNEANVTASISIQRLHEQTSTDVSTSEELLAALQDENIDIINLEPDSYDLSGSPAITRIKAVCLKSIVPGAEIQFAVDQDLTFIILGNYVSPAANTIYNITQKLFFPTIDDALASADPFDEILLFPGTYTQTTQIKIDKPLTLRGLSSNNTVIEFDSSLIVSLSIESDDVTIKNLHMIGPTMPAGDNWLFQIPLKAFPSDFYNNITISGCIIEGGRRNGFIYASNLSIVGCKFIHTGNRNSLNIVATEGYALISSNIFQGGAESLAAITYETGGNEITSGTIVIRDNVMERHSQFVLFNTSLWGDIEQLLVQGNKINHRDRSGNSIIFLPIADFNQFKSIIITKNTIVNENAERLGVLLDYRFGGAAVPNFEQIKVLFNSFDVVKPWGGAGFTVDPNYPIGFSDMAPVALTFDVFEMIGNTVIH